MVITVIVRIVIAITSFTRSLPSLLHILLISSIVDFRTSCTPIPFSEDDNDDNNDDHDNNNNYDYDDYDDNADNDKNNDNTL